MNKEQKLVVFVFLVLSLISLSIFLWAKKDSDSYLSFVSVWGSFASISAIIILFFQLRIQQKLAEDIEEKVNDTKKFLVKIFSISDVSKGPKVAEQAQTFLRVEKFESALLRLKDLKEILIYIWHYSEKEGILDEGDYNDHISNITVDLSNINDMVIGKKAKINTSKIIHNLEEVSTFISDFELKIKDHDS